MDLNDIRRQAEGFLRETRREWYLGGSGLKEEVRLAAIYAAYPDLFRRTTVEEVARMLERAVAAGKSGTWRLSELRTFLTLGLIRDALKNLTEQATNFESRATVRTPDGGEIPYRQSAVVQLNETDRRRREAIERARMEVVVQKNSYLVPIHEQTHALSRALGFGSYLEMMAALRPFALAPIRDEMRRFLSRTEALYEERMETALASIGVRLEETRRHDVHHLFRGGDFDHLFPAERLVPVAWKVCEGLGVDLNAQGRIRLDLEPRPRKSPRAFCSAVEVPDEVYLVIRPRGGHDDYRAFFHELGHALHFAHVAADAPFEAKRLGDNSVTEAYAMLFDHLLLDPLFLADMLGVKGEPLVEFLRRHALFELFMLRRYAAKIDYELLLHTGPELDGKDARYAAMLSAATRVAYPAASYLDDVDPFFYCANYLRAWMLQAQMAERLRERCGRRWWRSPAAGVLLLKLWKTGQAEDGDALSRRLGFERLTAGPLAEELERLLTA